MRMLGFTGTRSLYCSSSHYITHGTTTPEASGAIISPQVRSRGGGGLVSNDCVDRLQNCYIDCAVKYPDSPGNLNSEMRQGCEDSCDAAYNLCTSFGPRSGGLVIF